MQDINLWNLLRGGAQEQVEGLKLAERLYSQKPSPSHEMQLGVAYLWLQDYESAYKHFHRTIQKNPKCGDNDYGMAGVSKWCLGRSEEAVSQWRSGLEAKYARATGLGVIMPMLIFFASVLKPEACKKDFAEKLLLKTTKDIRIKNWPGPIAKMLLDQISEKDFQTQCNGNSDSDTQNRRWLSEFYKIVLQYDCNQISASIYKKSMQELADTSLPEWSCENTFLGRVWHEEFFLARYEAG